MSHRRCLVKALKARGWVMDMVKIHSDNSNDIRMFFADKSDPSRECFGQYVHLYCCMNKWDYRRVYNNALALEVRVRRNAFKVIAGGMAWVPKGLKLVPCGKLKIVKKEAA